MTQSLIAQMTEAVVAELNAPGTSFEGQFAAERHYRPRFQIEAGDLDDLRVTVVPRGISIEKATRAGDVHEVQIDVAVQKRLDDESPAAIDALMLMVQQIADHMRGRRLAAFDEAAWRRIENDPIYAVDHLDELRVFTSVLTLTYRVLR